jgi:DedD protein
MEKKKILLVAVSVGVFLVIVVSAAILFISPRPGTTATPTTVSANAGQNWFASGATREPVKERDKEDLDATLSSLTQQCQENYLNLYGDSGLVPAGGTTAEKPKDTPKVITVQPPSASGVPDVQVKKPAVQPKPAAKPATVEKPKVAATAEKPKPAATTAKSHRDFWVQVGSFTSRDRADGVKSTLDTKGLSAIITNQDVEGITRYRVRVGPYTSRNEADYWLAMIKSIDGFNESQIWQSQSVR